MTIRQANTSTRHALTLAFALGAVLGLSACGDDDAPVNGNDAGDHDSATADSGSDDASTVDSALADDAAVDSAIDGALPDGGDDAADASTASGLPTATALSDLPNTSAADYAHNRWGLIEATTLETYASTWNSADTAANNAAPNGRPAHLAAGAKLIVLQLNAANRAAGENYVPSNPARGVYVYELDAFRFNETRDTGLISGSVRYQASGPTTDAWLEKYGIDLRTDFVVFAAGDNTATNGAFFQDLARGVYWLRYWGADIRQLAILNGTLKQNYVGTLASNRTADNAVDNAGFSVADLRVDNSVLTLPLEDLLAVVDAESEASDVIDGFDAQLIIDARPTAQYNRTTPTASFHDTHPGQFITTAWNSSGAPSNDATGQAKSYVLLEGHVKGAVSFPWANLLQDVGTNNWKYKDRAALEAVFTTAGYAPTDKTSKVIVSQCRTNFEVQVNGFAALNILGYPTVYFDGSLVEYFSLVSNHPDNALNLQPGDAAYRFRTDTAARSQRYQAGANAEAPTTVEDNAGVVAYNVANGTGATDRKIAQATINRAATTTRAALDQDREYKRQ